MSGLFRIAFGTMAYSQDQLPVTEEYILHTWEVDDGLPNNTVADIAQTPDGYLWLATPSGLTRFDGVRFTTFLKKDTTGLESNNVEAVFVARNGDLWIGLNNGGVARRRGDRFETIVPLKPGKPPRSIISFTEDAAGGIWFSLASEAVAYRWQQEKLSTFDISIIGPSSTAPFVDMDLTVDGTGKVFAATNATFQFFDGTRFRYVNTTKLPSCMTQASGGGLWAIFGGELRLFHADGASELKANLPPIGYAHVVNKLCEDRSGNVWMATGPAGLLRFHDGKLTRVVTSQKDILCVTQDREGNIWAGMRGGGLTRLRQPRFSLRDTKNGLADGGVISVSHDENGKLWAAVWGHSVFRSADAGHNLFQVPPELPGGLLFVTALCLDLAGHGMWVGANGGPLVYLHDGRRMIMPFSSEIHSILQDHDGDLWIATVNDGLIRMHRGEFEHIPNDSGLTIVRPLAEDSSGHLWAGTSEGRVFCRQNGRFVQVPLPGAEIGASIRFIVPDLGDTVWIGALDGSLYRWRTGKIARLEPGNGLPLDDLRVLAIDRKGVFWIGTGRGLFRIRREELDAAIDRSQPITGMTSYGRDDGLSRVDFHFGTCSDTTETANGHLWFATGHGVLEIDPGAFEGSEPLSPVRLEEIQVGNITLPPGSRTGFTLPPSPGPLEIHYTVPATSTADQIHFRYRLIGLSDEWIPALSRRTVTFAHLPPGNYRFEVAAAQGDVPGNSGATAVSFTVRPAWWEAVATRVALILLGILALAWLVRKLVLRRVRVRMLALEQAHAVERERSRIARDMHDELGASLTQIAIASQLAKLDPPESVSGHVDEIGVISRRTVAALDEIVWAVNPRNDILPKSLEYISQYAIDFLAASGITCEVEIPQELPSWPLAAQVRHHLFLAVKETVNNIVKHAGADLVSLTVELEGRMLRILIADNGCGFEIGSERAGANGIRNMLERMEEAGGKCRIESTPGNHTRVIFELRFPDGNG